MKKNHKRISAAVLSLALGFTIAGAPMLAPVASAQASGIIGTADAPKVDLDEDVSLTINKFTGNPVEPGQTPTTPGNELLANVTFTVQKVTMTNALNTLAGWEEVNDIQSDLEAGNTIGFTGEEWSKSTTSTSGVSFNTADDSDATKTFGVGLYLVTESHTLDNYTVAKPFLVALPFTDTNGVWAYDQIVQPKNQQVSIEKSVDDANARLGDDIEYTISASIPAEAMSSLVIKDELPSELGVVPEGDIVVKTSGVTNAVDSDIELTFNSDPLISDYTVINNGASSDPTDTNNNDLTITLTQNGLYEINQLRENNPELKIVVEFKTKIVALPNNGVISNDAVVTYPGNVEISTEDDPEGGTETRLGTLTVTKVDESGAAIRDEDTADPSFAATFELWRCSLDNGAWTVSGDDPLPVIIDSDVNTADDLPTNPDDLLTSFSTDPETGVATIYGVRAFDFRNGSDVGNNSDICLVETKAPKGYALNPQPVPVTTYENAANPDQANYAMTASFENLDDTIGGQLPATGGYGTMALIGAGVLVAAAGGAAAVRGNRARNN